MPHVACYRTSGSRERSRRSVAYHENYIERQILGSRMYLLRDDPGLSAQLLRDGTREWDCPDIMEETVEPGWTCIDVGANLGFYALQEARLVQPYGRVLAVEPVAKNAEALMESACLNYYTNLTIWGFAASDRNGEAEMMVSVASNGGTLFDRAKASDRALSTFDRERDEVVTAYLRRLDDWLEEVGLVPGDVDFLRMDIEGYEVEALAGASQLLGGMLPGSAAFLELHPVLFRNPAADLCPTVEAVLAAGFEPEAVVLGSETRRGVTGDQLLNIVAKEYPDGWVLTFFRKAGL